MRNTKQFQKNLLKSDNEILNPVDKFWNCIHVKPNYYKLEFEIGDKDYRNIIMRELDRCMDEKLISLTVSKDLQKFIKEYVLVFLTVTVYILVHR